MTENKRIFWNIVATYGRSLYALACGLLTGRWVLMALGAEDYGLYGVVGGMTVFIAFFNNILASSISRFYTFSVGQAKSAASPDEGLQECQAWFNTAVSIHTIIPIILVFIGYPIGVWAVRSFLTIPPGRVDACIWVFRFACLSCFISMVNVPFRAMYTAKQYIAELTVYGVAASTLQACFLYYIASHPSDWLVRYAAWTCFIAVVPQIIICIRALYVFPECQVRIGYCWDRTRIKKLFSFAGWHAFGALGAMLRGQGVAILINKYFGARVNAAMSVANTVNGHSTTLVAAMQGAFTPAIVQACGAGNDDLMRRMAFRACKFGLLLSLVFILPLAVELDNVMTLWLKTPPPYAAGLCLCMLLQVLFDKSTIGHYIAVNAKGRIAAYQFFLGGILILSLPIAWLLVAFDLGVYSIGVALLLMTAISAWGRTFFARSLAGMSMKHWMFRILFPVGIVIVLVCAISILPRLVFTPSFGRLCMTTFIAELAFVPLAWFLVLDNRERQFVVRKAKDFACRFL